MAVVVMMVAVAAAFAVGYAGGRSDGKEAWRRVKGKALQAVGEEDLRRIAGMDPDDPCVRAPAHVARGMEEAKMAEVEVMLAAARPPDEGLGRATLMAAGYLRACRDYSRLWSELAAGERGKER